VVFGDRETAQKAGETMKSTGIIHGMLVTTAMAAVVTVAMTSGAIAIQELDRRWTALFEEKGWSKRASIAYTWALTIACLWGVAMIGWLIRAIIWWGWRI
jgi:hypothetical protein